MIYGKWLKGTDDLSALEREITKEDLFSWHLIVRTDDGKVSRCSLTPFIDSFCIRELSYTYDWELELMLRMTHAKLDSLGKKQVYADADICGFGFEPYKDGISVAKELVLPKHCKE